jgi:hypothetical protein
MLPVQATRRFLHADRKQRSIQAARGEMLLALDAKPEDATK